MGGATGLRLEHVVRLKSRRDQTRGFSAEGNLIVVIGERAGRSMTFGGRAQHDERAPEIGE